MSELTLRNASSRPYVIIGIVLFLLVNLSIASVERLRGITASILSPLWKSSAAVKDTFKTSHSPLQNELKQLRLENQVLNAEIKQLSRLFKDVLNFDYSLPSHQAILPARVIFRSPASWNSVLWIDIGEKNNPPNKEKIITKNSPVLLGDSIIGLVDYVGEHQSRVRLITDSGLSPSVRAVRGGEQDRFLDEQFNTLIRMLKQKPDFPEKASAIDTLTQLKEKLIINSSSSYLAKGVLNGTSEPLWRTKSHILKGTGFNYDFADEKGGSRDLRTGKISHNTSSQGTPLLKVNDLLMTTGMDGVFPEGLKIAEITKITPLKEGDYYYDLEARPTAGDLDDLSIVFVIPPLGYTHYE